MVVQSLCSHKDERTFIFRHGHKSLRSPGDGNDADQSCGAMRATEMGTSKCNRKQKHLEGVAP